MRVLCTALTLVGAVAFVPAAALGQALDGSRITAPAYLTSAAGAWSETSQSPRNHTALPASTAAGPEVDRGNDTAGSHRPGLSGSGTLQQSYVASPLTRHGAPGANVPVISHDESASTPRMPFFLMGAAVGGGITAMLLYNSTRNSDCTICHPVTLSPLVMAGGLVGGLGGLVVHGWVVESRSGRVAAGVALNW